VSDRRPETETAAAICCGAWFGETVCSNRIGGCQTHLWQPHGVPYRDTTSCWPFGWMVTRSVVRQPGLWLSPLFMGCWAESQNGFHKPPPFMKPTYPGNESAARHVQGDGPIDRRSHFLLFALFASRAAIFARLATPNDLDQAAGTGSRNQWQPTCPRSPASSCVRPAGAWFYGAQVPCTRLGVSQKSIYQMIPPIDKVQGEGDCRSVTDREDGHRSKDERP
jgi:hypothetical protein